MERLFLLFLQHQWPRRIGRSICLYNGARVVGILHLALYELVPAVRLSVLRHMRQKRAGLIDFYSRHACENRCGYGLKGVLHGLGDAACFRRCFDDFRLDVSAPVWEILPEPSGGAPDSLIGIRITGWVFGEDGSIIGRTYV